MNNQIENYLEKLEAKYDKFKAEAKDRRADLKIAAKKSELERRERALKDTIKEAKMQGKMKWDEAKQRTEEAWNNLEDYWKSLTR